MHVVKAVLMIITCMHTLTFAQQNECDVLFSKAFQMKFPAEEKMMVIEYGIKMVERNMQKNPVENRIKIFFDKCHRYLIYDQVQLYIDTVHSIMLSPLSKSILISTTTVINKKKLNDNPVQESLVDSFFYENYKVESCQNITGNKLYDKLIVVLPKKKSDTVFNIVYNLKSEDASVNKMVVNYSKGTYSRIEYTFYKSTLDQSNKAINKPVYDLFFNKDGSLLPQYKGYQVTDNRTKTSKNIKQ